MKVTYCIPSLYHSGGMERILTAKANWLSVNGYNVTILTTDQNSRPPFFALNPNINLIDFGLNFERNYNDSLPVKLLKRFRKLAIYKKRLKKYIRETHPDVIISLGGQELNFLNRIETTSKRILEVHFIRDYKKIYSKFHNSSLIGRFIGDYMTNSMIRASKEYDAVVVLSQNEARLWKKTNDNIVVIPNSLPLNPSKYPIVNEFRRAIAVGQLLPVKGYDSLIRAWRLVNEKFPDWRLDIYGSGPLCAELKRLISDMNLSDTVRLMGTSTDVIKEMRTSNLLLVTSKCEAFPMIMIEAMSVGLPIISFDCPSGPGEIIKDGSTGSLVQPEDNFAFANEVCNLIENKTKRLQYSESSINRYRLFQFDSIMQTWTSLFNRITASKNEKAPSN